MFCFKIEYVDLVLGKDMFVTVYEKLNSQNLFGHVG